MLERVVTELLFWAIRGGLAWFVAYEYAIYVNAKLTEVARALARL